MTTPDSALFTAIFLVAEVEVTAQVIGVHLFAWKVSVHFEHLWYSSHFAIGITTSLSTSTTEREAWCELREESLLLLGLFLCRRWISDLLRGCGHAQLNWLLYYRLLFFLFLLIFCEALGRRLGRLSLWLHSLGLLLTILGHHAFADVCFGSCWLHSLSFFTFWLVFCF